MPVKILDLCCRDGGASMGIYQAATEAGLEIEIHGVDMEDRSPWYPFSFHQGDALTFPLDGFDFYFASPPCQAHTWSAKRWANSGKIYPDIVAEVRDRLLATGKPFVLENVPAAPLRKDLVLCGSMFGLQVYRHRVFEVHGFYALNPYHAPHAEKISTSPDCNVFTVAGHGGNGRSGLNLWQQAMGIDWMEVDGLTQAIPPAYTRYVFGFLFRQMEAVA